MTPIVPLSYYHIPVESPGPHGKCDRHPNGLMVRAHLGLDYEGMEAPWRHFPWCHLVGVELNGVPRPSCTWRGMVWDSCYPSLAHDPW